MKPKAFTASLDDVDEGIKQYYKQIDDAAATANPLLAPFKGKYYFDLEGADGWGNEPVAGLKSALQKQQSAAGAGKAAMEPWEALGTLEEVTGKLSQLTALGDVSGLSDKGKVQAKLDALELQWKTKLEAELKTGKERESALLEVINKVVRKESAIRAIVAAGGDPDLLLPHVLLASRTDEVEAGKFEPRILDGAGEVLITAKPGETGPMSLEEFVASTLKTRFPAGFDGSGVDGTGSGGHEQKAGAGGVRTITKAEFEHGDFDPMDILEGKVLVRG